ncbi:unnamed protein product, partial [Amoebophrya sp. A120]
GPAVRASARRPAGACSSAPASLAGGRARRFVAILLVSRPRRGLIIRFAPSSSAPTLPALPGFWFVVGWGVR